MKSPEQNPIDYIAGLLTNRRAGQEPTQEEMAKAIGLVSSTPLRDSEHAMAMLGILMTGDTYTDAILRGIQGTTNNYAD